MLVRRLLLAPRMRRGHARALVASALLGALAVTLACASMPQARYPGPPVASGGGAAVNAAPRAPRPTALPEQRFATAETDVVAAGEEYVRALYAGDDETAAAYQPGFGPKLREREDDFELAGLSARAITWGEAGYADIDPDVEWIEVVARVRGRKDNTAGNIYYKIGFKRTDKLTIVQSVRRVDVREP